MKQALINPIYTETLEQAEKELAIRRVELKRVRAEVDRLESVCTALRAVLCQEDSRSIAR